MSIELPNRKTIRLQHYDYSSAGLYFVTIVTDKRQNFFGDIENGQMHENELGLMIRTYWLGLPERYSVGLDEFIIMPNHFHGIIEIINADAGVVDSGVMNCETGVMNDAPTDNTPTRQNNISQMGTGSLGEIVRYFKGRSTFEIRRRGVIHDAREKTSITNIASTTEKIWQRNYFERVIRDEKELNQIREYVVNNPVNWKDDDLYTPL